MDADGVAVPPGVGGQADLARLPVRSVPRGADLEPRPAAAPDRGRLLEDAAAPAAPLPAGRRPRRRQDDHGRAVLQGADDPRRRRALPRDRPGQPRRAVAGRAVAEVRPQLRDPHPGDDRDRRAAATRSPRSRCSSPGSTTSAANEDLQAKLEATDWDLVVVDEAHKMSAHYIGGEVKETKRYKLGRLAGSVDPPPPADDGDAARRHRGGLPAVPRAARRRPLRGQATRDASHTVDTSD